MKGLKNAATKVFDFFEIYLSSVAFIIMFICFVLLVFYRYLFHDQLNEVFELSTIAFLWMSILAASQGGRTGEHVVFTIVYDKLSEKGKLVCRLIGDLFIIVTFSIIIPYAYDSISFLHGKRSRLTEIPYNIVFLPFIIFVVLTAIHYTIQLVKDIGLLTKLKKGGE